MKSLQTLCERKLNWMYRPTAMQESESKYGINLPSLLFDRRGWAETKGYREEKRKRNGGWPCNINNVYVPHINRTHWIWTETKSCRQIAKDETNRPCITIGLCHSQWHMRYRLLFSFSIEPISIQCILIFYSNYIKLPISYPLIVSCTLPISCSSR